jgi:hypothetical protein
VNGVLAGRNAGSGAGGGLKQSNGRDQEHAAGGVEGRGSLARHAGGQKYPRDWMEVLGRRLRQRRNPGTWGGGSNGRRRPQLGARRGAVAGNAGSGGPGGVDSGASESGDGPQAGERDGWVAVM